MDQDLEEVNFGYSMKNVSLPSQKEYILQEYFQKDIGISDWRLSVGRELFKSGMAIIRHYARAQDGD